MDRLLALLNQYRIAKSQMVVFQKEMEDIRKEIFTIMKENGIEEFREARIQKRICPQYEKSYFIHKRRFDEDMNSCGYITYKVQEILCIGGNNGEEETIRQCSSD